MSKSMKNKYYEVGIFDLHSRKLVGEYVTELQIIKQGRLVHEAVTDLLYGMHGTNIAILWNLKSGSLPMDNRDVIDVRIPEESKYAYNR